MGAHAPAALGRGRISLLRAARDAAVVAAPRACVVLDLAEHPPVEAVPARARMVVRHHVRLAAGRPRCARTDLTDPAVERGRMGCSVERDGDRADLVTTGATHHVHVVGDVPRTRAPAGVRHEDVESRVAVDVDHGMRRQRPARTWDRRSRERGSRRASRSVGRTSESREARGGYSGTRALVRPCRRSRGRALSRRRRPASW